MAKPVKKLPVFNPEIAIGEESREIECLDCENAQFKVQLEPGYTDPVLAKGFGGKSRRVMFCPFCGGEELTEV